MAKSEKEIEELEEKNEQDGRWLFNKLQEVADLAETKKINTYVTSITFLSFANHLNKNLAPDSQMAVAVSLRVVSEQLMEEHEANQGDDSEVQSEEKTNVAGVPAGTTLH